MISSHHDPAFRYEDLARFAFDNCTKYGDPWHYAAQEVYTQFTGEIDLKGKKILATILNKLIFDYKDNPICQDLLTIEETIWEAKTQEDVIKIINKTIAVLGK